MGLGYFVRRTAGLVLAALVLAVPTMALAQATPPVPAVAPATQPASVEDTIRAALPQLKNRDTGMAAIAQLQALRDASDYEGLELLIVKYLMGLR